MRLSRPEQFFRSAFLTALLALAVVVGSAPVRAYSVFTHQEIVDLAWDGAIRPLLLQRFPGSTDAELREAHAYAYGGCAIQDMGYYPFAKQFFSNLTHYVRTGDFVAALLNDSTTLDEYAFAIGALSHYLGDTIGHSEAINRATPIAFPKLGREYGPSVAYDQDPHAHVRTEFAFDIGQLSRLTFAPPSYMRRIGLKASRRLLDRAFRETYGFEFPELVGKPRPALRSYRGALRTFIPAFAGAEVVLHKSQFPPENHDEAYRIFAERLRRADYARHWKTAYTGPGFGSHLLAVVVKVIPKVGVISMLAIKIPEPQTEDFYVNSVDHVVDVYVRLLSQLRNSRGADLELANLDLDTGDRVKPGAYPLTDETYAQLLARLCSRPERPIPGEVRNNILEFYAGPGAPNAVEKDAKAWQRVQSNLAVLKNIPVIHARS